MSDPMAREPVKPPDLFDLLPPPAVHSTQQEGRLAAAKSSPARYQQIIELLDQRGPLAGWQIAAALGCQLHQISGRLTEMRDQKMIENTGERRKNPRTGVRGEVVRLVSLPSTELNLSEIMSASGRN